MNISTIETATASTLIAVTGEVDADNCAQLGSALLLAGRDNDLTVDLSGVSFIDSSGISELLTVHRQVIAGGYSFQLLSPSAPVRRVLEITGLLATFGLDESGLDES